MTSQLLNALRMRNIQMEPTSLVRSRVPTDAAHLNR